VARGQFCAPAGETAGDGYNNDCPCNDLS